MARRLGCVVLGVTGGTIFGVVIGLLVLVLFGLIISMATPSQPRLKFGENPLDHETVARIEETDIDEMIEARNERRRRLGRPEIGDELADELQRDARRAP
jgi:hypothetical protein